jgi:2,4-dienoyl-CoA reductase-like NADH-dependent reductase (Old Yellow Enzyme family)
MTDEDLDLVAANFTNAARLALGAGFKVIELHMAHGYLLHSFLSPLTNHRDDAYGGDLRGRAEFPLRVARAVRDVWPAHLPLFVRLSVVDWAPNGLDVAQTVQISRWMKAAGVDLIDCSSGALVPGEKIPSGHPFQVPFAAQIRREAGIATGAVGFIVDPAQAEAILQDESADLVLLARAVLDDPYWPRHAAARLDVEPHWPIQYARAVRHFHDRHWRANALGPGRAAD